jgi:predicted DNA-binding transcriptional regulator YafY
MTSSAVILACIAAEQSMTIVYQDAQGIISVRACIPYSVERCANGNTIVRAYDLHRKAPRSFTLHRIQRAVPGRNAVVTMNLHGERDPFAG